MGSTFTNIHVRIDGSGPEASLDRVQAGIVGWASERGFELVSGTVDPDRTVAFGLDPRGGWINVYDETIDIHGNHKALGSLATALATSVGDVAIATSVFDSDLAWLGSFDAEGLVAELVHGEGLDETGTFVATLSPDFDRWAPLLVGEASVDDLRRIWSRPSGDDPDDYVSADDRSGEACVLLGIDGLRASTRFRHLDFLPEDAELRMIGFRIVDEEKAAASIGRSLDEDDEIPPGLYIATMDSVDVATGTPFEIQLQIANLAPEPVHGMLLWAEGTALERGHVRLDTATSIVMSAAGIEQSVAEFESQDSQDAGLGAAFDTLGLAGFPTLTTSQKSYAATFQAQAGVRVKGTALKPGRASLVFAAFSAAALETSGGSPAEGVNVEVNVR